MLWPASLYPGGLSNGRVWWAYVTYLAFFGGGTVWRLLRYGPLAARQRDQQARAWGPRAAQACFIAAMPLLHWGAVGGLLRCQAAAAGAGASAPAAAAAPAAAGTIVLEGFAQSSGASSSSVFSSLALYDALGFALLAAAVALNWAAARALGQAYDRVVQPQALVTTRPYAWVQHPIHASYTLLFCGVSVCMHSFGCALLALAVCLVYCRSRVALEGAVLQAAFGDAYDACRRATPKLFAPFLL
jgi:protein-S-isoprenylcysteine O-methyltransferase Ste14